MRIGKLKLKEPSNCILTLRHKMNARKLLFVLIICNCLFFIGCAFDVIHVKQTPAQLEPIQSDKPSLILEKALVFDLDTNYSRTLKAGTEWIYHGSISEGDVYKSRDQVLTVEGSNIFEAYIVVKEKNLAGFYLPIEKTFSKLEEPLELPLKKN